MTLALVSFASGCARDAPGTPSMESFAVVRDSVELIVHPAFTELQSARYRLRRAADFLIGGSSDNLPVGHDLYRVVGGALLPSGIIAVADEVSREVRLFDHSGTLVSRAGGRGSGPGRFESISWLAGGGDSVYVWDGRLSRLTVLSSAGNVVRTLTLPIDPSLAPREPAGRLPDGGVVMAERLHLRLLRDSIAGPRRDPIALIAYRPGRIDTIATVLGPEEYLRHAEAVVDRQPVIFGRSSLAVVAGHWLVVGTTDSFELTYYDSLGVVRRTIRVSFDPQPVTLSDVRAARDAMHRAIESRNSRLPVALRVPAGSGRPLLARDYLTTVEAVTVDETPWRETLPAFSELLGGDAGALWVRLSSSPDASEQHWVTFDAHGSPTRDVSLPRDYRLLSVQEGRVLVHRRDDAGVDEILLFELELVDDPRASTRASRPPNP